MKDWKRIIGALILVGVLVASLSAIGNMWHSNKVLHTAKLAVSRLGGTYTQTGPRFPNTGYIACLVSNILGSPIVEVDLSVDAWPRSDPNCLKPPEEGLLPVGTKLTPDKIQFALVTDADVEVLLSMLPDLEKLNLRGMPITDRAVDILVYRTKLQRLDVSETQVSDSGMQQLREALPNCEMGKL